MEDFAFSIAPQASWDLSGLDPQCLKKPQLLIPLAEKGKKTPPCNSSENKAAIIMKAT
jgi:hypothetical protein